MEPVVRTLTRRGHFTDRNPRILTYHSIGVSGGYDSIGEEMLADHFAWLRENYNVVPLHEIQSDPTGTKRITVTVDDGLTSFAESILPCCRTYNIPVTVFVPTIAVSPAPGTDAQNVIRDRMETPEAFMSIEQLQTVATDPLVTIGAHTWTHQSLATCTDPEMLQFEIVEAADELESVLGTSIDSFAYPFNDWGEAAHEFVTERFSQAVHGRGRQTFITPFTSPHRLPRMGAAHPTKRLELAVHDVSTLYHLSARTLPLDRPTLRSKINRWDTSFPK